MHLLNICVLLFYVILVNGEDLSTECHNQMLAKSYEADDCMAKLGSPQHLIVEFNHTVLHHSENEVILQDVETVLNKMCDVLPKYFDCALIIFDVAAECPREPKTALQKFVLQEMITFSNYACANNGEKIKLLIPYNGLKFLFLNNDFDKCTGVRKTEFEHIYQLCPVVEAVSSCAIDVIGDHPNKNILSFVQEITSQLKYAANC